MPITRTLYSTQKLDLYLTNSDSGFISGLPVQSASIDRTIPTENVLTLGKLGALGRQQKSYETVKMSVKLYWTSGAGVSGGNAGQLTHSHLATLTGNALNGTTSKLVLGPNGFTGFGILTNFAIDASVGEFLTATLNFDGFGTPAVSTLANSSTSDTSFEATAVNVYTSANVILADSTSETIKSAKFSLDIPAETLGRLGSAITGLQTDTGFTGQYLHVAKPPFKVSVSYDGEFVTGDHATSKLTFGHLAITPVSCAITSQKFDQKAGDIGAEMSFTSEGTSCTFSAGA